MKLKLCEVALGRSFVVCNFSVYIIKLENLFQIQKKISPSTDLVEELVLAVVDHLKLNYYLYHLLSNSLKKIVFSQKFVIPEVYIYGNGFENTSFVWNLFLDCLFVLHTRYDYFNFSTKRAEMQEKISFATEYNLWKCH